MIIRMMVWFSGRFVCEEMCLGPQKMKEKYILEWREYQFYFIEG